MDHYGDGIRRRHNSSIVSDGGIDEPGKNCGHNDYDSNRHKQLVQELGCRRSSMGVNAAMPVYHSMAKVSVFATDRLHHTVEHENTIVLRKKTQ